MFNFDACKCGSNQLEILEKTDVQIIYKCLDCKDVFSSPATLPLYHDDDEAQTYME